MAKNSQKYKKRLFTAVRATCHSAVLRRLVGAINEDQMMPTEKRPMCGR